MPPKKKISDMSRNLLVIVCDYLMFFEIVALVGSSKNILCKLDDCFESNGKTNSGSGSATYFKRRGTLFFQNFFFEQFPCADIFVKRMTTLTSYSPLVGNDSYLPFVKQSSICEHHLPELMKQESMNQHDFAPSYTRGSTVTTNYTDKPDEELIKPTYLTQTFITWKSIYLQVVLNKKGFIKTHENNFYTANLQKASDYAREIFLDPANCENPCFALP